MHIMVIEWEPFTRASEFWGDAEALKCEEWHLLSFFYFFITALVVQYRIDFSQTLFRRFTKPQTASSPACHLTYRFKL